MSIKDIKWEDWPEMTECSSLFSFSNWKPAIFKKEVPS